MVSEPVSAARKQLGAKLRECRVKAGLSIDYVSNQAGITIGEVKEFESGRKVPQSFEYVRRIMTLDATSKDDGAELFTRAIEEAQLETFPQSNLRKWRVPL